MTEVAVPRRLPIIVSSYDRISRVPSIIEKVTLPPWPPVISASDGLNVDRAVILGRAKRAEYEADMISVKTKAALDRLTESGHKLGNHTNLREAQRLGADANRSAAAARDAELTGVFEKLAGRGIVTPTAISSALDGLGVRPPRGPTWSVTTIRRIQKRIADRRGLESGNPAWGLF
jgi:hypothetical protein